MNLKKKFVVGAASVALIASMGVPAANAAKVPLPNGGEFDLSQRLAGDNRLATSMAVAKKVWKDHENEVQQVYLIGYDAVIDAATAGMLNGTNKDNATIDGPMLSVPQDSTTREMLGTFIKNTFPMVSNVIAVGGTAVVSDAALKDVADAAGVASDRIAGKNRYATSVEIAKKAYPLGPSKLYLTRGDNPVDALAAGTLQNAPVLLINREGDVDASLKTYVADSGITSWNQVMVIGGEQAVPKEQIEKLFTDTDMPEMPEITPWTAEEVRAGLKDAVKTEAAKWFGQENWQQITANAGNTPTWSYADGKTAEQRLLDLKAIDGDASGFFPLEKTQITVGTKTENESDIDINDAVKADGNGFEGYVPLTAKYEAQKLWANSTDDGTDGNDAGSTDYSINSLINAYNTAVQNAKNAHATAAQIAAKAVGAAVAGDLNADYQDPSKKTLLDAIYTAAQAVEGYSFGVTETANTAPDTWTTDTDGKTKWNLLTDAINAYAPGTLTKATATADEIAAAYGQLAAQLNAITNAATLTSGNNDFAAAIAGPTAGGTTTTINLYNAAVALFGKDSTDKYWPVLTGDAKKVQKTGMFKFESSAAASELVSIDITTMVNADKASGAKLIYIEKDKGNRQFNQVLEDASTPGLSASAYNATIGDLVAREALEIDSVFAANQTGGNDTEAQDKNHSINWYAVKDLLNERNDKFNAMKKNAAEKLIKAIMDYNWVGNANGSELVGGSDGAQGVCRINGMNRYQTSALLSIFQSKPTDVAGCEFGEGRFNDMKSVYLASGTQEHLIDPVFAGMVKDGTILLVPATGDLDTLVSTELKRKGTSPRKVELLKEGIAANSVWAIGGTAAITDDVFKAAAEG